MNNNCENNDTPDPLILDFINSKPETCDILNRCTDEARICELGRESTISFKSCINRLKGNSAFINDAQEHLDVVYLLFKFILFANIANFQNTEHLCIVIMLLSKLNGIPRNYLSEDFVSKSVRLFEAFTPKYKIALLTIYERFNLTIPNLNKRTNKTIINYVFEVPEDDDVTQNQVLKLLFKLSSDKQFRRELLKKTAKCLVEEINVEFVNVVIKELNISERVKKYLRKKGFKLNKAERKASVEDALRELQKEEISAGQLWFSDEESDVRVDPNLPSRYVLSIEVSGD